MPKEDSATFNKILDSAELLFSKNGIEQTSVRAITDHAGVNVASISYHFGSKQDLILQMIKRRMTALWEKQISGLDALEKAATPEQPPALEAVIEAFIDPLFELAMSDGGKGRHFLKLIYENIILDPEGQKLPRPTNGPPPSILRLDKAINLCLEKKIKSPEQRFWRIQFLMGTTHHTIMLLTKNNGPFIHLFKLFGGKTLLDKRAKKHLIQYIASGIRGLQNI